MQGQPRNRSRRVYYMRLSVELTEAVETELRRREMTYTAWFREILMEVGLSYSRQKKSVSELMEEPAQK